jgi:hypothetical protein
VVQSTSLIYPWLVYINGEKRSGNGNNNNANNVDVELEAARALSNKNNGVCLLRTSFIYIYVYCMFCNPAQHIGRKVITKKIEDV